MPPETILTARLCMPAGMHTLKVNFLGKNKEILQSYDIEINIKVGEKNFIVVRSSMI
ncbi:MAG: hypothetical protein LBS81_02250 [Endomicrobium sp.]|jgi:hypothetical protein|nr:hypothetical protein [Endomicrobium sp.]